MKKICCCFRWIPTGIYRYEAHRVALYWSVERYSALKSVSRFAADDRLSAFSRQNITACGMERTWREGEWWINVWRRERGKKRKESLILRFSDDRRRCHVNHFIENPVNSRYIARESFARRRQQVFKAWKDDLANDVDRALGELLTTRTPFVPGFFALFEFLPPSTSRFLAPHEEWSFRRS